MTQDYHKQTSGTELIMRLDDGRKWPISSPGPICSFLREIRAQADLLNGRPSKRPPLTLTLSPRKGGEGEIARSAISALDQSLTRRSEGR